MVVTFCLAFGNEAYDIPFVIVNDELPYMSDHCPPYNEGCKHLKSTFKAMLFLSFLLFTLKFLDKVEEILKGSLDLSHHLHLQYKFK